MVTEHSTEAKHCTNFKNTMLLPKMAGYMDHIKTRLHPNNFNTTWHSHQADPGTWLPTYSDKAGTPISNRRINESILDCAG
jgi:hypothetical protein